MTQNQAIQVGYFLIHSFEFFAVYTKLLEMAIFASKDFTVARNGNNGIKGFYSTVSSKKKLPPVGLNLIITGSTDYHCFNSLLLNQLNEWYPRGLQISLHIDLLDF